MTTARWIALMIAVLVLDATTGSIVAGPVNRGGPGVREHAGGRAIPPMPTRG